MKIAEIKDIIYWGVYDKYAAQIEILKEDYFLQLTLRIGIQGESGADDFDVVLCSIGHVKKNKFFVGAKSFIVDNDIDDIDDIESQINHFVSGITGEDWNRMLIKLRRYFDWEYENSHK